MPTASFQALAYGPYAAQRAKYPFPPATAAVTVSPDKSSRRGHEYPLYFFRFGVASRRRAAALLDYQAVVRQPVEQLIHTTVTFRFHTVEHDLRVHHQHRLQRRRLGPGREIVTALLAEGT